MKILVIGNGAREHALLWKLAQSHERPDLFAAPGNAGTGSLATNLPVDAANIGGLLSVAMERRIDLTIVGPEVALAEGVVNSFQAAGLQIFGPTREAAQIETSKSFAKELMTEVGVPTAPFRVFDDPAKAGDFVRSHGAPIVVKADGVAAGKGVVVANTIRDALEAIDAMMIRGVFGSAGKRVVIEDCLEGQEVSVFGFTDGISITNLVAACDYKRAGNGDTGPNTGGIGGYSPPLFWTPELEQQIREAVLMPTITALANRGTPFVGVLYGGLMLTSTGIMAIEFNARFGDPEAQLVLPRLNNDLLAIVTSALAGRIDHLALNWSSYATVGVVLTSTGYPGFFQTGMKITGLNLVPPDVLAFHAGTAQRKGDLVTSGGRVITLVGRAPDLPTARARCYAAVNAVNFEGSFHRSDIATFA